MAYKQLPIVENYRIPIAPDDEDAALNYLFASEDVLEQIRLSLRDGYLANEVPIALRMDVPNVILEGNRRISALKADGGGMSRVRPTR